MARGISVHVGINKVSPSAFSAHELLGCENDAQRMRDIALSREFQPDDARLLLGEQATFANVELEIRRAAGLLNAGDIFLFTFAGHGSYRPDEERLNSEEPDRQDEALVLFDRLMLDDYLRRVLWPTFKPGVRIIGVTDSCHSATVLFAALDRIIDFAENIVTSAKSGLSVLTRAVSARHIVKERLTVPDTSPSDEVVSVELKDRAITERARQRHREDRFKSFYDDLRIPSSTAALPVEADLLLMAACEDGKTTKDELPNGAFTKALLEVWNGGIFQGNYVTFMDAIKNIIADRFDDQVPVLTVESPHAISNQQPFSI